MMDDLLEYLRGLMSSEALDEAAKIIREGGTISDIAAKFHLNEAQKAKALEECNKQ